MTQVGEATQAVEDRTTTELLGELSDQLRRLIRAETRLATVELRRKGKRAALGAGAFGIAAAGGLLGGGAVVTGAIVALDTVVPLWLAALATGVAILVGTGLAALLGRHALRRAFPPVPSWAMTSAREDVRTIVKGAHR